MIRWLPFDWFTAMRFMRDGWVQTIFILVGVSLGVGVTIFMSEMLSGVQANFLHRVLTAQAMIVVLPPDELAVALHTAPGVVEDAVLQRPNQRPRSIDQWQNIRGQIEATPGVSVVAPIITGPGLAVRGNASASISVIGSDPADYFRIVRVPDYIVHGQLRLRADDILIGVDLAQQLGVAVADKITVVAGTGGRAPRPLTVTGIFDLGSKGVNLRTTFVALRTGQSLVGLPGGVTSLEIALADPFAAEATAQLLAPRYGVRADSWIFTNKQFFIAVQAQNLSSLLIRISVGLSAAFGVASVLVVSVVQRAREIGILRAMGGRRGQILRVFLIQGGIMEFGGAVLGSALGAGILLAWNRLARQPDGSEMFPFLLDPWLVVGTVAVATLVGVLAGMAPAMQAARLDPAVAIRG